VRYLKMFCCVALLSACLSCNNSDAPGLSVLRIENWSGFAATVVVDSAAPWYISYSYSAAPAGDYYFETAVSVGDHSVHVTLGNGGPPIQKTFSVNVPASGVVFVIPYYTSVDWN